MTRAARFVPVLALICGITLGAWILFGPTYTVCSSGAIGSGSGETVTTFSQCHSENLVTAQRGDLFPAPVLWIAAWALAPLLAVIGTRSGSRGFALAMTSLAFAVDAMSIISMGGGFVFALLVAPLLLLTLVLIGTGRPDPTPTSLR